jgi:hypothetical protein
VTKLLVSILLFAFLGQTFNQGWYYLDYQIQKKEYVKRCVNKARPMLHCNGKCQLMKKIEAQQKKEQGQAPEMKYANKVEVLSSKSSFLLAFDALTTEYKKRYFISNNGEAIDQSIAIFHPPPAVC